MQSTLLIIIGLYLLMLPVIGIIGRRMSQERTLRDFYLAGGGLTALPLFFTLYATQYSGNTLFGFAGNAYREGPVIFFAALGMAIGAGTIGLMGAFALAFVPPWAAFRIARSWRHCMWISSGIGIVAYIVAFVLALSFDQPFGPVLVAVLVASTGAIVLVRSY